jgi:hypothetical protein
MCSQQENSLEPLIKHFTCGMKDMNIAIGPVCWVPKDGLEGKIWYFRTCICREDISTPRRYLFRKNLRNLHPAGSALDPVEKSEISEPAKTSPELENFGKSKEI